MADHFVTAHVVDQTNPGYIRYLCQSHFSVVCLASHFRLPQFRQSFFLSFILFQKSDTPASLLVVLDLVYRHLCRKQSRSVIERISCRVL